MGRRKIFAFGQRSQLLVLSLAISACSTQPQKAPAVSGAGSAGAAHLEECSMLGVLACRTMSMLSGDAAAERRSTCAAYKNPDGSRVEKCGSVEARVPEMIRERTPATKPAQTETGRNILSWSDNANNESNFVIERCDQVTVREGTPSCTGDWKLLGAVEANVTRYVDDTAIAGQPYLYRVKATNRDGSSGYTEAAVIKTPSR